MPVIQKKIQPGLFNGLLTTSLYGIFFKYFLRFWNLEQESQIVFFLSKYKKSIYILFLFQSLTIFSSYECNSLLSICSNKMHIKKQQSYLYNSLPWYSEFPTAWDLKSLSNLGFEWYITWGYFSAMYISLSVYRYFPALYISIEIQVVSLR